MHYGVTRDRFYADNIGFLQWLYRFRFNCISTNTLPCQIKSVQKQNKAGKSQ